MIRKILCWLGWHGKPLKVHFFAFTELNFNAYRGWSRTFAGTCNQAFPPASAGWEVEEICTHCGEQL